MSTWGFFPIELSCLTAITVQSVGFRDISEGNGQETQDRGKWSILEHSLAPGPIR